MPRLFHLTRCWLTQGIIAFEGETGEDGRYVHNGNKHLGAGTYVMARVGTEAFTSIVAARERVRKLAKDKRTSLRK